MAAIATIPAADDAAIADWLHGRLARALERVPEGIAISIPGGSTPFPILRHLAARDLEWSRIAVWPGDDRAVSESHPASNAGRIRALLGPLGAHVQALDTGSEPPHFALVWLGMGADGHIASLFPSADPGVDDPLPVRRLTPDPLPPEAPFERISLTIPALLDSDELLFVIRGEEKRAVFEQAYRGGDLPIARLLGAARQPVTCFT